MKRNRRILALGCAGAALAAMLVGCGGKPPAAEGNQTDGLTANASPPSDTETAAQSNLQADADQNATNMAGNAMGNSAGASSSASSPASGGALSQYVGKYPNDTVGGTTFLTNPLVKSAVSRQVTDVSARAFVLGPSTMLGPIIQVGNQIQAKGCEPHNCSDHNWAITIDAQGSNAQICVFDAGQGRSQSNWYALDGVSQRAGDCVKGS